MSIANATIRIGATAEDVGAAVSSALSHFQRLNGAVASNSHAMHSLKHIAMELAAVFGGIKLLHFASDAVQKVERAELAFEVMLKSATKAKTLIKDLQSFEFETPFKFTELTSATQRLLTAQFALEDIPTMLRIIGDAASASGDSLAFSIERITRSLGQMNARGHITGEEIRELAHANISARRYLVEELSRLEGKPVNANEVTRRVEHKEVSSGTAMKAILAGMDKDFGGLMKRVGSETFEGVFKRIASQAELAMVDVVKSLDKAFHVKKYLGDWVTFFADIRQHADGFGEALNKNIFIKLLITSFTALKEIISVTFDVLRDGFMFFNEEIGGSSEAIGNLGINTKKLRDDMLDMLQMVTRGFVRLGDAVSVVLAAGKGGSTFWNFLEIGGKTLAGGAAAIIAGGKNDFSDRMVEDIRGNVTIIKEQWAAAAAGFGTSGLEKQLEAVDGYFDKMRAKNHITHNLSAQLGISAVVQGLAQGNDALEKFHRKVGDLKGLNTAVDFSELIKANKEEGLKYLSDARTPLEKIRDELAGIQDAYGFGELTSDEYAAGAGSALQRASKGMKGEEARTTDAMMAGSNEAQRTLAMARQQSAEQQTPDLLRELIRESEAQNRTMGDLLRQAQQSGLLITPVG